MNLLNICFQEDYRQLSVRGDVETPGDSRLWPMISFASVDDAARAAAVVRAALNEAARGRIAPFEITCECCSNAVMLGGNKILSVRDHGVLYSITATANMLIELHVALLDVIKTNLAAILDGPDDDSDRDVTFYWERP